MTTYGQDIDMENQAGPSTVPFQMNEVSNSLSEVAGIPVFNLYSVGDYLEKNASTLKPDPTPIKQQVANPSSEGAAVVVGSSIITAYPRLLNEYIVSHQPNAGIPEYIYTELQQSKFSVLVRFRPGFQDIEPEYERLNGMGELVPRVFPSKKLAKEEGARCALEYLQSLPANKVVLGKMEPGEESSNGRLNTWCSKNKLDPPFFTDFQSTSLPYRYGCTVKISLNDQLFGDGVPIYLNKKTARNAVAKLAMEWIDTTNPAIPITTNGGKRHNQVLTAGQVLEIDATGKSPGVLVGEICPYFGFVQPRFDLEKKEECAGMYDIYAVLERLPSTHAEGGPVRIGPAKNIFGQKNAKEHMAKTVFRFLEIYAEQMLRVDLRITGTLAFTPVR